MDVFGYSFRNPRLLEEALTTPSYRMDHPAARDNQRLEFLGDAVLGVLAADMLYRGRPGEEEGRLTVDRARIVSTESLCSAAARISLAGVLKRSAHLHTELPHDSKALADAIEAVIGAAWIDGGLEAARAVFDALGLGDFEGGSNPKGDLQIATQALDPPRRPEYILVSASGPAHQPVFHVKAVVEGVGEAEARAGTRKKAESEAAAILLAKMKGARK